jgi:cysteine desulfurase/selenocysteine lyase
MAGLAGLHSPLADPLAAPDPFSGLPDVAELAQLATALFNELPAQWEPGKTCPELATKGASLLASSAVGDVAGNTFVANTAGSFPVTGQTPGLSPKTGDAAHPAISPYAASPATTSPAAASPGGAWTTVQQADIPSPASAASGIAALESGLPGFDAPLPEIQELAGLALGLDSKAVTSTVSPYYFLEHVPPAASVAPTFSPGVPGIQVPGVSAVPFAPPQAHPLPGQAFDVQAVRRDFPILGETVNGRPLVWLDNAATTQKPQFVIDRLAYFYAHENSNIHRAAHELAARATDAYEAARDTVRRFLNAGSANEIVFVRGTTEGINLVAQSWGRQNLKAGDEILITWLEHHANIVPWQQLAAQTGAVLKVAPVNDLGEVRLEEYEKLLGSKTKLVSFTQVSNALGTVTPAAQMTRMAHAWGAKVLVDGAQSVSHLRADVQALDCDWFVFSGHKVFGPTGIGAVYGKEGLLNATDPWQGGGNMIRDVTFEKTLYHDAPARFEAGTGNIADAVGLGAALEYVERLGIENIARHEHDLLTHGTRLLEEIPGVRLIGKAAEKAGVLSFVLAGYNTEEVGAALNKEGIAVRSGHHCAQPILRRFGLEATVRPSLALYNTHADLDALAAAVWKLRRRKSGV